MKKTDFLFLNYGCLVYFECSLCIGICAYAVLYGSLNSPNIIVDTHKINCCFFSEVITDKKGKQRKKYPYKNMMTPYDKLKSLTNAESYLKDGVSFNEMDKKAYAITDNQSADRLQKARRLLFKTIDERILNQL